MLSEAELTTGIEDPVEDAAEAEPEAALVDEPKLTEDRDAEPVDEAAPLEKPAGVDVNEAAGPDEKVGTGAEENAVPVAPPAALPEEPAEPAAAQPPAEVQTCPDRQQPPKESVHPTSPALQQPLVAHDSPDGQQSDELGQVVKPCEEQVAEEALIEPINSLYSLCALLAATRGECVSASVEPATQQLKRIKPIEWRS